MPIHDQGYRHYLGHREAVGRGWLVITLAGIKSLIRKRIFLGLLLGAWLPFIVYTVRIYVAANFPSASVVGLTAQSYRGFLDVQANFVFFVTVYVGAGLIANDRRANALQIYLSKPLTRTEYVAGKLGILLTFLLLVTWAPTTLLLFMQVVFTGSFRFIADNFVLLPAIAVYSIVQVIVASFTMLALSSLSKSSRFVAVMYTGVLLFTTAMYGVIYATTRSQAAKVISPAINVSTVGDAVFRIRPFDSGVATAFVALVALVAFAVFVLERRIRGVEVVT